MSVLFVPMILTTCKTFILSGDYLASSLQRYIWILNVLVSEIHCDIYTQRTVCQVILVSAEGLNKHNQFA
jgi:hypothetical protein